MKFKITESIQDKGIFKAIFMAGSPGAGKSYTLSKITDGTLLPRIVNTDKFMEYFGKLSPEEDRVESLDTSKQLTENQLYLYINSMLPLYIDATASGNTTVIRRNGILQSIGYDTGMIFINTPFKTAWKRIESRNKQMPQNRQITKEWALYSYKKTKEFREFYHRQFPFFQEINNDEGELTDKVILDAYKNIKNFYRSPIENPEGKRNLKIMTTSGWKYMIDGMVKENYLKKLISIWYMS